MDTSPFYQESFKAQLERNRREAKERQQSQQPPLSLSQQVERWWQALPEHERYVPRSMESLLYIFPSCPQKLGPALYAAGFRRVRVWTDGPYRRYWVKQHPGQLVF